MEIVKLVIELYFGFFALLGMTIGFLVLTLFLPMLFADGQGHVRTTKETSFANARVCQNHKHFVFDEVKMKNLFGRINTYTVYAKPENIVVRTDTNILATVLSVYPNVLAYFFIDNCAAYYFDARRINILVPNLQEAALWQTQIDQLRETGTEKCRYENIVAAA